jgi:hypothetical protein
VAAAAGASRTTSCLYTAPAQQSESDSKLPASSPDMRGSGTSRSSGVHGAQHENKTAQRHPLNLLHCRIVHAGLRPLLVSPAQHEALIIHEWHSLMSSWVIT